MTFEAQGDPLQAAILVSVVLLPFGYWWLITVPEARLDLAKDKRLDTDLNEYLVDLKAAEGRAPEKWFFDKWLQKAKPAKVLPADSATAPERTSTPDEGAAVPIEELFRPASLAGNATPKFWSGDNPIVVTMAALLSFGIFAAIARSNNALAIDGLVLGAALVFGLNRLTLK